MDQVKTLKSDWILSYFIKPLQNSIHLTIECWPSQSWRSSPHYRAADCRYEAFLQVSPTPIKAVVKIILGNEGTVMELKVRLFHYLLVDQLQSQTPEFGAAMSECCGYLRPGQDFLFWYSAVWKSGDSSSALEICEKGTMPFLAVIIPMRHRVLVMAIPDFLTSTKWMKRPGERCFMERLRSCFQGWMDCNYMAWLFILL